VRKNTKLKLPPIIFEGDADDSQAGITETRGLLLCPRLDVLMGTTTARALSRSLGTHRHSPKYPLHMPTLLRQKKNCGRCPNISVQEDKTTGTRYMRTSKAADRCIGRFGPNHLIPRACVCFSPGSALLVPPGRHRSYASPLLYLYTVHLKNGRYLLQTPSSPETRFAPLPAPMPAPGSRQ